eukprot:1159043-Pelagomonas_calceolata.AAC.8
MSRVLKNLPMPECALQATNGCNGYNGKKLAATDSGLIGINAAAFGNRATEVLLFGTWIALLLLASGDSNGSVAVWDVQCQSVCATLDDALLAVTGNNAPKVCVCVYVRVCVFVCVTLRNAQLDVVARNASRISMQGGMCMQVKTKSQVLDTRIYT